MISGVTILVGHRGVGKSTLAQLIRQQQPELRVLDLDEEIERSTGQSLARLIADESHFRKIEIQVLTELVKNPSRPTLVAAGAGLEQIPEGAHVVWIRRSTDASGRCFLNRPRLNPKESPLEEYLQRYEVREKRFSHWAHEQIGLPEGGTVGLESFFTETPAWNLPFVRTLLSSDFRNWTTFWKRRENWGVRFYELRSDLLSSDQIAQACRDIPASHLLFSVRNLEAKIPAVGAVDWALELGDPKKKWDVISLHEGPVKGGPARLARFENLASVLKWSPLIETFSDLELGHQWWLENPKSRAFLPRSPEGRWQWYRTLFGPQMPLHFFRESEGSALDQPLLWQAWRTPKSWSGFAAVLGHPIHASRSPVEHLEFFGARSTPFVAIPMREGDVREAWPILLKLGLRFAAVTSPLKSAAVDLAERQSERVRELQSANTLIVRSDGILADNTDVEALLELAKEVEGSSPVLWGGGGVRSSVRTAFPSVQMISARQGGEGTLRADPLIWAVGRSREFLWPREDCEIKCILDLNYTDDSPGLELAVLRHVPYQSGLKMFKLQAKAQQNLWLRLEETLR
ncbi:MAG: shikimate kinase [Bdellovibrionales bacterium]